MSRVLIANMPFSNLRWPNLGPSLLKAALKRQELECDVAYFNFDFAEQVGLEPYYWIADYFAFVLGGERLFAKHYFDGQLPDDVEYRRHVLLAADPGLSEADWRDYQSIERYVGPFLDRSMASVDWSRYGVVGFAASFQQTMPSMCLARRIKERRPEIKILFGGAACEGEMGIELLRHFPLIDYVFLGEADLTFGPVVSQLLQGNRPELPPGVIGRDSVLGDFPPACREVPQPPDVEKFMVHDLNELPYPDFDDYFARLERSPLEKEIQPLLFFETSRGCWWGQKHHCKFCGLNGSTLAYRSKNANRAVDELKYLVGRHHVYRACSADNILDYRYFDTFLPLLRDAALELAFVFEMKTNLTRPQVEILLGAGMGAAQLGIETFITPVLKMIGKGANAIQNLQTLKWFSEAAIEVKWNILYGFPGEEPDGYRTLAELIGAIVHLAPPLAVGRVRLDRFAPYFDDPQAHGMINPRPNRAFAYVYPFAEDALRRLAYYYEYDYADGRDPLDYAAPCLEAIDTWRQLGGSVTLRCWDREDGLLILTDTRPCATAFQHRLKGLAREVYLYCDTGRSEKKILKFAVQRSPDGAVDAAAIRRMLDGWLRDRVMVLLDDRYLSLALWAPEKKWPHPVTPK